jgi:hypothetical protein
MWASVHQLLHRTPSGFAGIGSRLSSRRNPQISKRPLAVHHKMVLLGTWLLTSCALVAAMGIWGISVIQHDQVQLTHREVPVLTQLLRTDVDLHEAQYGLERVAATTDPLQRKAGLDFFFENVAQSAEKFATYKSLALGGEDEAVAIIAYEADRVKWLKAADDLVRLVSSIHSPEASGAGAPASPAKVEEPISPSSIEKTRTLFQTTRSRLNRIILDIYQPAIEASGDQLSTTALVPLNGPASREYRLPYDMEVADDCRRDFGPWASFYGLPGFLLPLFPHTGHV